MRILNSNLQLSEDPEPAAAVCESVSVVRDSALIGRVEALEKRLNASEDNLARHFRAAQEDFKLQLEEVRGNAQKSTQDRLDLVDQAVQRSMGKLEDRFIAFEKRVHASLAKSGEELRSELEKKLVVKTNPPEKVEMPLWEKWDSSWMTHVQSFRALKEAVAALQTEAAPLLEPAAIQPPETKLTEGEAKMPEVDRVEAPLPSSQDIAVPFSLGFPSEPSKPSLLSRAWASLNKPAIEIPLPRSPRS